VSFQHPLRIVAVAFHGDTSVRAGHNGLYNCPRVPPRTPTSS